MIRIHRSLRVSLWLIQSFFKRYNRYLLIASIVGALSFLLLWKASPFIKSNLFPKRTMVGLVGAYRPEELPLYVQQYISAGFTEINVDGEAVPFAVMKWE